jgi:hypothetical protein
MMMSVVEDNIDQYCVSRQWLDGDKDPLEDVFHPMPPGGDQPEDQT